MLRKLHRQTVEVTEGKLERKKSKRERIAHFFRSRRLSTQHHGVHSAVPSTSVKSAHISHPTPPEAPKPADASIHKQSDLEDDETSTVAVTGLAHPLPEENEEQKDVMLTEEEIQGLFSGAPQFSIRLQNGRSTATATYAWNTERNTSEASDSTCPSHPAFMAATLHTYSTKSQQLPKEQHIYPSVDVVEVPSMLSAQGLEPGSIGLSYFLELPTSDSLVTDQEGTQSSKEFLQASKNKELLQTTPERLGIRTVDMGMIYSRLLELQDIYEAFKDSPGPISILNNQSAGDLYANLFSKFLTPPGFDGSADDPTGLEIQITTLLRVLKLKGVWYDFSLVEWRIRLGQILWSDPEPVPEHEPHPLWTEREILLLQIVLACELFLRLDASNMKDPEVKRQDDQNRTNIDELLGKKSRKLAWDLILARRFLDNILVVKSNDGDGEAAVPKSRGFLAILGGSEAPKAATQDVILLPQHQGRQLSGLLEFAERIQWPNTNAIRDIATKLGMRDSVVQQLEQLPSADKIPISPASISVYGTPLQTPRSSNHMLDGYFGHIGKPALKRDNSQSLRIPLSPMLSPLADHPKSALTNIGGWLSRSFLTGLVLPGEAISHFLISTLLENDHAAIACLGDSANLYGGFTYAERTWWSKNSIVGRVLACVEGSAECMGWISIPKPPQGLTDSWHSIYNESVPFTKRPGGRTYPDAVSQDSAVVPSGASIRSEDFVLPVDIEAISTSPIFFSHWELMPLNRDLIDDNLSGPPTESDVHAPIMTFTSQFKASPHTLTMAYDVQFVTSWPCTPPGSIPVPSLPLILRRSLTGTVSRTSSKRSVSTKLSRRNSHGFEPLLSHPPDSTDIAPKRMYAADVDDDADGTSMVKKPMKAHPLHISYKYKIVPASDVLQPDFSVPFDMQSRRATTPLDSVKGEGTRNEMDVDERNTVLVLDARSSADAQLLSRAWCAELGFNAILARVGRTCLGCCIREARGLNIHVVIRI